MARPRVGLVVSEVLGLVRNGGIATATTYLSFVLADQGYDVELIYCGRSEVLEPTWEQRYREHGVTIQWLDRSEQVLRPFLADSYRLYQQLKNQSFDVLVFQDWQGLGFCSAQAKRCGLAFADTHLVHICHGPTMWLVEANRQLELSVDEVLIARLERGSAEMADTIISPSRHLLDWMTSAGWALPERQDVIPYFTDAQSQDLEGLTELQPAGGGPLNELVFFGRLEERKGVRTLCGALNLLGPSSLAGLKLTFLGRAATVRPEDVRSELEDDVVAALSSLSFIEHLDQPEARSYLRQPGRLAVMPSHLDNSPCVIYECIEDRVPFLASRAGGTGELVHPDDRSAVLFDPTPKSLAACLKPYVVDRVRPSVARPSYSGPESLHRWQAVLSAVPAQPVIPHEHPLVSVVVTHHDRPRLLPGCLDSLMRQDYPALEIIVVDDGSELPASTAVLDDLERQTWSRPLRVIRQDNCYLGCARNTGVRSARGDLVVFVDDDDLVDKDFVSLLVRAFFASGADAVTCAIATHGGLDIMDLAPSSVWPFLGDAVDLAPVENLLGGAPVLTRPSTIEAVGGYHEIHGTGHEDWDLLARLVLHGRSVAAIPEHPYRYRVHSLSMVRTGSTHADMQPVFESLSRELPVPLRVWPQLLRGLHERTKRLESEVRALGAERDALKMDVELRDRYLYLMRHGTLFGA